MHERAPATPARPHDQVGGLGVVMRMGGDKVQEVVEEKSGVSDIRGAVRPPPSPPPQPRATAAKA